MTKRIMPKRIMPNFSNSFCFKPQSQNQNFYKPQPQTFQDFKFDSLLQKRKKNNNNYEPKKEMKFENKLKRVKKMKKIVTYEEEENEGFDFNKE